jgi:hypothetical protein
MLVAYWTGKFQFANCGHGLTCRKSRAKFRLVGHGALDCAVLAQQSGSVSTNTWIYAYLAAFALIRGLKVVSFDGGFEKLIGASTIIL